MLALLLAAVLAAPNPALTPGAVRLLTKAQICGTRWGLDHRFVTVAMKKQVAKSYGLPWSQRWTVEFDHLVPRELGGADAVANLWPQKWPEARVKDRAENQAHRDVCARTMTLEAAQDQMRHWGR